MIRSPVAGLIAYEKEPGERVAAGEVVAIVVDPLCRDFASARTELKSRCDGVLYGRAQARLTRPGMLVCRVAGKEPFPERKSGNLLTD
jgi:predicted deacylase